MKYTLGTISPATAGSVSPDWAQIANKTAVAALTNTTISTSQTVSTTTNITNPVTVGTINASAAKYKKNAALNNFGFTMQSSATGGDQPGLIVASKFALDGGSFSNTSNSVTEVGLGWYNINLLAVEMNATFVKLQFTAASAVTRDIEISTQP